ncbi:hypothetical protein M0534_05870 [Methylonatrum kenyense]|uniref:hypothetical protein n=1 Tax=Methylonatrum kenyense TaxID=455253 RepID=UPI0020BED35E|nr:hypothetical protein [Methylonatrum kenyense]MCK8515851.1 hypothetical protein [Methylonatrum kenyense]
MADDLELFNALTEDTRKRADSLAKAVFVLSGGALTVSIGIFTSQTAPTLTSVLLDVLKWGWVALFLAIISLVLCLLTIIWRDYSFAERWRKKLDGEDLDTSGTPGIADTLIWGLGVLGIAAFVTGMFCLAYVSVGVIEIA